MRRILSYAGKTVQIIITILLGILLLCNLYLLVMEYVAGQENPAIGGFSMAVIASGSMEPALSVDDLIFNRAQDDYEEGEIITFQRDDSLTTHRIVSVTKDGYITKGDANNATDPDPVLMENVVGRVVWSIPSIGRFLAFLKTPLGMMILVLVGFIIIEFPFFLAKRKGETVGEEL